MTKKKVIREAELLPAIVKELPPSPEVGQALEGAVIFSPARPRKTIAFPEDTAHPPTPAKEALSSEIRASRYLQVRAGTRALIPTNLMVDLAPDVIALFVPTREMSYTKGLIITVEALQHHKEIFIPAFNPLRVAVSIQEGEVVGYVRYLKGEAVKVSSIEDVDEG